MGRLVLIRSLKQVLLILSLLAVWATVVCAGITGSKHDFSGKNWGSNEICIFCHTPHNANKTITNSPLWNHQVTGATYTLYSSSTLKQTPTQPNGPSKLCLSCHDGTVAVDSFGSRTGSIIIGTGYSLANPKANLGTDLSNDHPISIAWDHQTSIGVPCTNCHNTGHGSSIYSSVLPFYGTHPNQTVECGTCHEPHNKGVEVKMLRKTLTGSAICLHCHGK